MKIARGLVLAALGCAVVAATVAAQESPQQNGAPARAVRLSYVDGQVSLSQGGQTIADPAVANTPLFEGMQLTTRDSGKAEIQFEDGSVVRISPDSSLTLAALHGQGADGQADLLVNSGLVYFELQGGNQSGQTRVLFGNNVATASGFTVLRVSMDNAPGALAVFSGNAHLEGNNGAQSLDLHGGESIALNAGDPNGNQVVESIEPDSWDGWNSDRDQALNTQAATQTGAATDLGQPQNPAWSDLDANGNWYNVPGQGYVWSPYDAANGGWDPYGVGSWMWTPGYGYIWASGYSWGYLPFSCGAWNFYDGFGWGWAPGFGGCSPWWGMGFYGGPIIGYAPPAYLRISRPVSPRHPVGPRPIPMLVVNRRQTFVNGSLPLRQRNTNVTIAGANVQALRPLPAQSMVRSAPVTGTRGFQPIYGVQRSAGQPPVTGTRPGYSFARPVNGEPAPGGNGAYQNRGLAAPPNPDWGQPANNNGQQRGNWTGFSRTPPSGNQGAQPGNGAGNQNNGGSVHPNGGSPGFSNARPAGGPPAGGGNSGGGGFHPSGGAPSGGAPSGGSAPAGGGGGGGHSGGGGGGHH